MLLSQDGMLPGNSRTFTREERFGLLVQKGGGMTVDKWLTLPNDTKVKILRLFEILKAVPDRFLTSDVQKLIQVDFKVVDHQRYLMMLFQGGYLLREKDFGHRVVHIKTEKAKAMSDETLAADLVLRNDDMIGWPVSTRPRTRGKGASNEVQAAEVVLEIPATPKEEEAPLKGEVSSREERQEGRSLREEERSLREERTFRKPPVDLRMAMDMRLDEAVAELDEADVMMLTELARSLRAARAFFPKLKRKDFLRTFIEGGRYVED